jgi:hypothetical protein
MPAISLDDKAALTMVFTDAKKIEIGVIRERSDALIHGHVSHTRAA